MSRRAPILALFAVLTSGLLVAPLPAQAVTATTIAPGAASAASAAPAWQDLLTIAQQRLARVEKELVAARTLAAKMRKRADQARGNAADARRDLGNFARAAYATGGTDLLGWAGVIDSPNPSQTMRRAVMAEMVAEHQDHQWDRAVEFVAQVDDLRAKADDLVATAELQVRAARSIVKQIQNRNIMAEVADGGSAQNGTAQLLTRCTRSEVLIDLCVSPPWTERNLTLDAVVIGRQVNSTWPQVKDVGGWRPSDSFPDHPSGRAVDVMMPHGGATAGDVRLGNEIAEYFQRHAAEYGIYYMIWRQRMWKASDPIGQWSGMSDRGSPTANHMDHVHITVTNGKSGTAFEQAMFRAQR